MKIKIDDVKSYDGFERHVEGSIDLDGNNVYEFYLDTYDGFTSIHLIDGEFEFNLECDYDCEKFGLTEDEGIELYDEILDVVNDNGYDFIGEDFE